MLSFCLLQLVENSMKSFPALGTQAEALPGEEEALQWEARIRSLFQLTPGFFSSAFAVHAPRQASTSLTPLPALASPHLGALSFTASLVGFSLIPWTLSV